MPSQRPLPGCGLVDIRAEGREPKDPLLPENVVQFCVRQNYYSVPARYGHTVDRAGTTHTFRTYRGIRMVGVIALAVMLVIVCAVTIAHGPQGGFNVWVKIAFIVGFVVPSAWFAVRWFRLGVEISPGG